MITLKQEPKARLQSNLGKITFVYLGGKSSRELGLVDRSDLSSDTVDKVYMYVCALERTRIDLGNPHELPRQLRDLAEQILRCDR